MTFGQFFMFHEFPMTIFIFQVFQSPLESMYTSGGEVGWLQLACRYVDQCYMVNSHVCPPSCVCDRLRARFRTLQRPGLKRSLLFRAVLCARKIGFCRREESGQLFVPFATPSPNITGVAVAFCEIPSWVLYYIWYRRYIYI